MAQRMVSHQKWMGFPNQKIDVLQPPSCKVSMISAREASTFLLLISRRGSGVVSGRPRSPRSTSAAMLRKASRSPTLLGLLGPAPAGERGKGGKVGWGL